MTWIPRPRLETALRAALDQPGPALVVLRGPEGSGRSGLLRRVLPALDRSILAVVGRPGPGGPGRLDDALARAGLEIGGDAVGALLRDLESARVPRVLVVDDAPTWVAGEPEARATLSRLWSGARARALPLHLLVVGPDDDALDELLTEAFEGADPRGIVVGPVGGDDLRRHLSDWSPADRYLIQACLGGSAETLGRIDPGVRAATNLQRLVVDPDGPLHGLPGRRLRERLQKPDRYVGIVRSLARGAREWGEIRQANPTFTSGNQLAPYLATLQDMGWVEADRSLDAAPESRRRRYRLIDPFPGFWYGVVEPALGRLLEGAAPLRIGRELAVDDHAARVFPDACRRVLAERGDDILPVRARETGGLWGDGYDLPVAGTLVNGAAVYGRCVWGRVATEADAEAATRAMRATRYGFGRQARLRMVFTSAGVTEALVRRAAREPLLRLADLASMF